MTAPITNASDLNDKVVRDQVFMEMVHENTLLAFMGTDVTAPIQMIEQPKKAGDTIVFPFLNALEDDAVSGSSQLQGNTEDLDFQSDSVTIILVRYGTKVEDQEISEQRAPFEVLEQMRPLLVQRGAQHLRDHIIDHLGNVSEGRNRNRYLYGATDANWNATHTTALANIDSAADKMSLAMIGIAKLKANLGGTTAGLAKSHKMRPFRMMMDNGAISNVWVALLHPTAAKHLREDPLFLNLNLYQGESKAPKLVDGSRFMGVYQGVLLYELDEIDRLSDGSQPASASGASYTRVDLTTAGATSEAVVHNVLLGAQAVGVGIAERPFFRMETTDFGRIQELAAIELRGITKLVFNSVDNGVIHIFSSGVL